MQARWIDGLSKAAPEGSPLETGAGGSPRIADRGGDQGRYSTEMMFVVFAVVRNYARIRYTGKDQTISDGRTIKVLI